MLANRTVFADLKRASLTKPAVSKKTLKKLKKALDLASKISKMRPTLEADNEVAKSTSFESEKSLPKGLTQNSKAVEYAALLAETQAASKAKRTLFNNIPSQANCVGTYRIQAEKHLRMQQRSLT
ncbi:MULTISPECIES: hypothetical protein [Idiomarina]|uniref:hypothetical protein n=1 Tax=Idiomarina TaxID=135575 RepID=UPI00129C6BBE|nr:MULTISPECIES: hypothetical protein [Idiomarina]MRJ43025.1 hypothetical protein [Idiomarina sp. FeN1]NCU58578.1 hypothetical protein [Idiomarina sp. FenA--70]NCU61275.1 hypothetical protein [Idiomarina sp. FenBw--71]UUN13366.1 hypothetical protein KGF88_12145 [Idiomarina loihiensis]